MKILFNGEIKEAGNIQSYATLILQSRTKFDVKDCKFFYKAEDGSLALITTTNFNDVITKSTTEYIILALSEEDAR